jgi:ATP-dependent Clp protease ATP-binding subunit ClpA
MSALVSPKFGFGASEQAQQCKSGAADADLEEKITRTGAAAACRRFTPEFINRLDKIVTFKPLGTDQLSQILDIELKMVQQRIFNASQQRSFLFEVTEAARTLLLSEGTDARYGARHLKRAIERLLVQPMCNLIATRQVCGGDCIRVDWEPTLDHLAFIKETSGIPCAATIELASKVAAARGHATSRGIVSDVAKTQVRLSRVS